MVLVCHMIWPITVKLHMPVPTEKYIELRCDQIAIGFCLPLGFNIAINLACTLLGFICRKVPDNFNESWFIFVAVATTLMAWLVLIPAYVMAFYAAHQAALMALGLLINVYITLGGIYVPRVYALIRRE